MKHISLASAARRQIIGGGAPTIKSRRRRRRSQFVGGDGEARRAQGSMLDFKIVRRDQCIRTLF